MNKHQIYHSLKFKIMKLSTSSCIPLNPFIKLDEDGQASILSYQIPQESSYSVNGYVGLDISKLKFKQTYAQQTTSPIYNSLEEIKQLDTNGIQQAITTNNKILNGYKDFEKNINKEVVQLEKLSNNTLLTEVKNLKSSSVYTVDAQNIQHANISNSEIKK